MVVAAERHGMQVMWTLLHYGMPDDVDMFSPEFPERFARFSAEVAKFMQSHSRRLPFYTPVNEISFFSWAAGEVGWFRPFGRGRGGQVKRQLIKAVIASCEAIDLVRFLFRPFVRWNPYSTPNPRLFLCSSSTPPGGGVHGMCGFWAAQSAMRQLR